MRLKIQQTRPKDLNEAVKVAIELKAFDRAERQRKGLNYARGSNQEDEQTEKYELKKLVELIQQTTKKGCPFKVRSISDHQEKQGGKEPVIFA